LHRDLVRGAPARVVFLRAGVLLGCRIALLWTRAMHRRCRFLHGVASEQRVLARVGTAECKSLWHASPSHKHYETSHPSSPHAWVRGGMRYPHWHESII